MVAKGGQGGGQGLGTSSRQKVPGTRFPPHSGTRCSPLPWHKVGTRFWAAGFGNKAFHEQPYIIYIVFCVFGLFVGFILFCSIFSEL